MSADQSTMAVSIFVLVPTIPTPASVMRDLYWEQMARRAEVSDQYLLNIFACASGKERKGFCSSYWKKNLPFDIYIF